MKKITIYYVRHGKTLFNELGRMQGHCDAPLTDEGIEQAYKAKEELRDVHFDRAYTSTSERCIDTAHIVLEGRDVPLTYTKKLKEMNWGSYEGALISEHLDEINPRRYGNADWSDVGGENLKMLKERVLDIYGQIFDENEDGASILVVSHGAIFMHMIQLVFGLNRKYMYRLMEEHGEKKHPVSHGFAGVFQITDGVYELLQLNGHYDSFMDDLKAYRETIE